MGEVKIVLTFDLGTVYPNQCTPVPMCKYLEPKADITMSRDLQFK